MEEAHLLISMLESYEIPCDLTNDYIIAVDPLMSNAVHGIDILVDDDYVEDAKTLLGILDKDEGSKHCPHCGSAKIRYLRLNWWNLVFIIKGFILPVGRKRMYCMNCLKKFNESEAVQETEVDDALTKEALSCVFEDSPAKPVPTYLPVIGIITLMCIFFGIYSQWHYSNYRELPSLDFFIILPILVGVGYILYSLLDPEAEDDEEGSDKG